MEFGHFLVDTAAYIPAAVALTDLDEKPALRRVAPQMHSIAEIVAHMAFWQTWFLKRCRGVAEPPAAPASLGWPPVSAGQWDAIRQHFLDGAGQAAAFGSQDGVQEKPLAPAIEFPPLARYTVRDALVHVATHNAHHLGQVITLRQMMGMWPPPSGSWTW